MKARHGNIVALPALGQRLFNVVVVTPMHYHYSEPITFNVTMFLLSIISILKLSYFLPKFYHISQILFNLFDN